MSRACSTRFLRRRLSSPNGPTYPKRRVYSVVGVPPEVQAYALAKYSRSGQGMLESIQELSQQKAEQFLNTFYFQYGHRSIADLAHLVFGLEQISILAAIAVVDEQVWDGQERSTRYQPFRKTGWHLPAEVAGTPARARRSRQTAEGCSPPTRQLTARCSSTWSRPCRGRRAWPRQRIDARCARARSTSRARCCRWPRTPASARS